MEETFSQGSFPVMRLDRDDQVRIKKNSKYGGAVDERLSWGFFVRFFFFSLFGDCAERQSQTDRCMRCISRSNREGGEGKKRSNVLMGCCAEWMDSAAAAAAAAASVLIVGAAGRCGQAPQRSEDYLMSVSDASPQAVSSSVWTSRGGKSTQEALFSDMRIRGRNKKKGGEASRALIIDQHFFAAVALKHA